MSIRDAIWSGISRPDAIQGQWTAICLAAGVAMRDLAMVTEGDIFVTRGRDETWRAFHDAWLRVADMPARSPALTEWLERTRAIIDAAESHRREALAN